MLFHPHTDPGVAEAVRSLVTSGVRRRRHALKVHQQLMLLAAIVFIPLLILHLIYAVGERHHLMVDAGYRARDLVSMAAKQHEDALRADRKLVGLLAKMPQIAAVESGECQGFLEILTRTNPELNALAVVRPDGSEACASPGAPMDGRLAAQPPLAAQSQLATQPWVKAALGTDRSDVVLGDGVTVDPVTRRSMIGMAEPIFGVDGERKGALAARIDLQSVWTMVARAATADAMDIMLLDDLASPGGDTTASEPLVIASSEAADVGRRFARSTPFFEGARSSDAFQLAGLNGTQQIFSAAPMPGAPHQVLVAGVAVDDLLANMRRRATVTLVGVGVVGALVLASAWFMARWSFLRPLGALVAAAKKLRAGDLKTRVSSRELWAPEFSELAVALNIAAMRLERNHRTLSDRANRDGLTGLASRRRFDEQLDIEWRRARRAQTPLSALMIAVDEFKKYNDRYGHVMGDECLRQIAGALVSCLRRPSDMAARYGGEEIVILLPDTDLAGAAFMGSRLLTAVHELGIVHRARPDGIMSVSIGVASVVPGDEEDPMPALVKVADAALYAAKRQGRARVVVAGAEVLSA